MSRAQGNPTVTLTGWKAVAALVVLAGFAGFRMYSAYTTLDTQGREALESWVQGEVMRPILADSALELAERGQALLAASTVSIRSLQARGPLDNMVVKVELEPNAALPEDAPLTRYYRMRYSTITGWTHRADATVLNWYLAAF